MKKRICALFLAVFIMLSLTGCVSIFTAFAVYDAIVPDEQQYAAVVKANWGLDLPQGYERLYYNSEQHPRGEGPRYCVLSYEDESVLDNFRDWTTEDGATTYCDSYSELVEETVSFLEVPEEYRVNCDECVWWYCRATDEDTRDELLMLRDGNLLYIVEGFY